MPDLELRVLTGTVFPSEHVFTSADGLLAGEHEITESMEEAEIQLGDISLEASRAGTFLDAASRDELPLPSIVGPGAGGYRSVLRRGGADVLNGVIPLIEVAHDVSLGNWAFTLLGSSQEDLWARLEEVRLDGLSQAGYDALAYDELPYHYKESLTVAGVTSALWYHSEYGDHAGLETYRWYDLLTLCEVVLSEISGLELTDPLSELSYAVSYIDNATETVRSFERTWRPSIFSFGSYGSGAYAPDNLTLPAWTGRELFERVLAVTGWRLRARYKPFPSTDIEVSFLPDRWPNPDPATLATLDTPGAARAAAGGYTRRAEPGTDGGFALRHAGSLRPLTPEIRMVPKYPPGYLKGHGAIPTPPPTVAQLAQSRWLFEAGAPGTRTTGDPEPLAETIYETGFTLPLIGHSEPDGLQLPGIIDVPDSGGSHGAFTERVIYGIPVVTGDWEAAYIGSVVSVDWGDGPVRRLLWARDVFFASDSQHTLVNEVWARELYQQRSFSVQALEVADGDFYVHDLSIEVGVPETGASLEERAWMLQERSQALTDDRAKLVLVRPASDVQPAPESPHRAGIVQDLAARYQISFDGETVDQRVVLLTWAPPPPPQSSFQHYEVEWRLSSEAWGANPTINAYATAHLFVGVSHDETFVYRVRTVDDDANSAYVETSITTNDDAANV